MRRLKTLNGEEVFAGVRHAPFLEHFQAKWNHLAARKIGSNKVLECDDIRLHHSLNF
jgi:hypothetical protein